MAAFCKTYEISGFLRRGYDECLRCVVTARMRGMRESGTCEEKACFADVGRYENSVVMITVKR